MIQVQQAESRDLLSNAVVVSVVMARSGAEGVFHYLLWRDAQRGLQLQHPHQQLHKRLVHLLHVTGRSA